MFCCWVGKGQLFIDCQSSCAAYCCPCCVVSEEGIDSIDIHVRTWNAQVSDGRDAGCHRYVDHQVSGPANTLLIACTCAVLVYMDR